MSLQRGQLHLPTSNSPQNNDSLLWLLLKEPFPDLEIDLISRLELSVLRVSIYQSTKPQHIRLPDFLSKLQGDLALSLVDSEYNIIDIMTTTDTMPHYTIQSRWLYDRYLILNMNNSCMNFRIQLWCWMGESLPAWWRIISWSWWNC